MNGSNTTVMSEECVLWTGKISKMGYGYIYLNGKTHFAHRLQFEKVFGAIPAGMQLHHLCGNRSCVNPRHLEIVSPLEHAGKSPRVTHCPKGHEMTEENSYRSPSRPKYASCLRCRRDRNKARYE